jgi:hypothetical protein
LCRSVDGSPSTYVIGTSGPIVSSRSLFVGARLRRICADLEVRRGVRGALFGSSISDLRSTSSSSWLRVAERRGEQERLRSARTSCAVAAGPAGAGRRSCGEVELEVDRRLKIGGPRGRARGAGRIFNLRSPIYFHFDLVAQGGEVRGTRLPPRGEGVVCRGGRTRRRGAGLPRRSRVRSGSEIEDRRSEWA